MKKTKYLLPTIALSIFASSISAEIYIVKHRDNLSKIIKKKFSDGKIYGTDGILEKILALNPKIKNPDLIFVNQKINLPEKTNNSLDLNQNVNQVATEQPLHVEQKTLPAPKQDQMEAPSVAKETISVPKQDQIQAPSLAKKTIPVPKQDQIQAPSVAQKTLPVPKQDQIQAQALTPKKHDRVAPPSTRVISNDQLQSDNWTLKILYGIKFLSLDQSKTLTGLNLATLANDNLKFESEFKYDNLKFIGSFESHSFSYASSTLSHQTKLSTFEFNGVWNNYLMGFSFKETPLIKATTTSLDLTKESQIGLMLGYDKTWFLPTTKPTSINLRSSITIPFSGSSDKTDTTISSLSGFELKSNLELSRTIIKREDYSLNFIWQNELVYGQTSRNVHWGSDNGKVDLTKIEAKSLIGLGFSF